jgi:nucleotide-binding universal stress UspA family protein
VIVGVVPNGDPAVIRQAAKLAQSSGVPLVVAHVDTSTYIEAPDPDGYAPSRSGAATESRRRSTDALRGEVGQVLRDSEIFWSFFALVGDPGAALHGLAERVDASMFVIGTRRDRWGEALREFFEGSVAIRLARHQSRPIVIVPTGAAHQWQTRSRI